MNDIKWLLFDWGDTLMFDNPDYKGEMYLWKEISLMKGVSEALPLLSNKYKCAVVSNASDSNAQTMKKAFERGGIDRYFSLFITSKEIGYKKPSKEFFMYIVNHLNTPFHSVCMIGNDYDKDIITPHNLGMSTILITQSFDQHQYADRKVSDFAELLHILL